MLEHKKESSEIMWLNKKLQLAIITVCFLFIGLGYAYLNTTMSIGGTTKIGTGSWNVKISNVNVTNVSQTTTFPSNNNSNKPTVITGIGTHEIDYNVIFNQPGDYYEFTFDVVNSGDVDAALSIYGSKLKMQIDNGTVTEYEIEDSLPSYLDFSRTSVSGSLYGTKSGNTSTIKIRIGLKSTATAEQLALIQGKTLKIKDSYLFLADFDDAYAS